ncbi:MAG: hypothetical protein Q8R12_02845 [bacterium]|nr:hypothetical protein [bacterium]
MLSETKRCQNCKAEFKIEPEDFKFYEKIKVPPPTWCPECRMVRRMTYRNEHSLYRRKDLASGNEIISMFAPNGPFKIYEHSYWWSDKWDPLSFGREYDFSKPFFVQFRELFEMVPLPNLANSNVINSEYGNHNADLKNCYLVYASFGAENVAYTQGVVNVKDSFDLYTVVKSEQCYEDVLCAGLYKVFFSYDSDDSLESSFLKFCKNTNNSLACINLRSKSYHIFNKAFSTEDYEREKTKINLGSYKNLISFRKEFEEFSMQYPRRHASIIKSVNVAGDMVMNSKNCFYCFDVYDNVENSKYASHAMALKDSYDGYGMGLGELFYEAVDSGIEASRYKFTVFTHTCRDVQYTYACHNSSNLFACVGLRNKSYCILNKQYTKEEYEKLVPRIIEHMNQMPYIDKKGRVYKYGEFFPPELSPFSYNETIAQEYFPLTKEEAIEKGYSWKDPEPRNYKIQITNDKLPDHIKDATDDIVGQVIECAHQGKCNEQCTEAYKIIPQELQFLRKMNLPLPRLCPNCRHYARIRQRNPLKLWHRKCQCAGATSENKVYQNTADHIQHPKDQHCQNEFETTYAPERPEIVYCEQCYIREVV